MRIGCSTNTTRLSSGGDGTFCIANGDAAIKFLGFEPVSIKHAGTSFSLIRILFFLLLETQSVIHQTLTTVKEEVSKGERDIPFLSSLCHVVGERRRAKKKS